MKLLVWKFSSNVLKTRLCKLYACDVIKYYSPSSSLHASLEYISSFSPLSVDEVDLLHVRFKSVLL